MVRRELFYSNRLRGERVTSPPHSLPQKTTEIIKEKLVFILQACACARQRREQAEYRKVPEAEVRSEWDHLLMEFMRTQDGTVMQYLERHPEPA